MFKEILVFVCGAVFGGIASLVLRAWNDKRNQSRVGTDNNVIKEVADGITDTEQTIESVSSRIETVTDQASEVADTSRALADLIRNIEERERKP